MEHRPFPKIPLRLRAGDTVKVSRWVATEKIHGAHFVVGTDGDLVRFGKRKSWLEDGDSFFGWQLLRSSLDRAARNIHRRLEARGGIGSIDSIYLYGELHGGGYPHPDVAAMPGASPVQTGIWYAPHVRFALFDILLECGVGPMFLGHTTMHEVTSGLDVALVPTLLEGSRAEVEALSARFETRVPGALGLPPLPNNFAEGLVLKPDADIAPDERPVIKIKIPEFSETRFDESEPWNRKIHLSAKELCALAGQLVNPARVASARSKVGDRAREELVQEIVLDVLIDLDEAFPVAMASLDPAGEEQLRAYILEQIRRAEVTIPSAE